jgi:hypothetical protein
MIKNKPSADHKQTPAVATESVPSQELSSLNAENEQLKAEVLKFENDLLKEQLKEQVALIETLNELLSEQGEELEQLKSQRHPILPGEDSAPSFNYKGTTYRVVHGISTRLDGSNLVKVPPAGIAENKALRERLVETGSSAVVKA